MVTEVDTRCGYLGWYPKWLQFLASKKSYAVIYGLIGMTHFAMSSYMTGTLTTIEKRFKFPSQTTGLISASLDFGYVAVIFCSYMGSTSHKTKWVAYGGILVTLACFIRILPHVIYGPGQDSILLAYGNVTEILNTNISVQSRSMCGINNNFEDCSEKATSIMPTVILLVSQVILGLGLSTYWSLGVAYMDDNARKDKIAVLVSFTAFVRMLGPTIGFFLASYALEKYIDPALTPKITTKDPRWIGAWWYAWIPLGVVNIILSLFMAFFPRTLPRAAIRLKELGEHIPERKRSCRDFAETVKRLFRNKLLLLNTSSTLFYMFGMTGYWVFLPKYMESQFQQSASKANIVTGSVGLVFTGLGLLVSGGLVTLFKPSARFLAGWNMFVESLDAIGHYMFILLGCPLTNFHGTENPDKSWNLITDCNANCSCTAAVKYDPVCNLETNTTFFSPCHAGCDVVSLVNNSKIFSNCSCAGVSGTVIPGTCPVDCERTFFLFVLLMSFLRFTSSTGRAGNSILQFRCVSPKDKTLAIGLLELCLVLFAFIPGPIFYGILLDSVCIIWGQTCGKTGNCWLYDGDRLRFNFNMTASTFLLGAAFLDLGVWYYAKDLKLYDDDHNKNKTAVNDKSNNHHETNPDPEAEEFLVHRAYQSPVIINRSDNEIS